MRTHEYYEELCALLPIGQLSAEEYQELGEHLRACSSCRDATDDFSVILERMPVGETSVDENTLAELQGASYRERFLKRAIAEGVPFTEAVTRSRFSLMKWSRPRVRLTLSFAAAAVMLIAIFSLQAFRSSRPPLSSPKPQTTAQSAQPVTAQDSSHDSQVISRFEARVAALEAKQNEQQSLIADLRTKLSESRSASQSAKESLSVATSQLAQAQKEAHETRRALDAAEADLTRVRSDQDNVDATLVEQQMKINDLTSQLREKAALVERERQLSSVAKDVRELMGARNLHILDVFDVDGNGKSKKSFGRVFLVQGKSLIFYAFDLGDRGNPAKVSFQAWGQLDGRETGAKNLGVFYVDDHAQQRWVLKVNDPAKLSAISSVFVTVEPLGGADRPTGKKLLYAYLGTQANHP